MDRTFSSLPISVGTGLAVESLVQLPLARYQSVLFNVRTLFRNALSAYEVKETYPTLEELTLAVEEDMRGVAEALTALVADKIHLIFYQPTYKGLPAMFPLAKLKLIDDKKSTETQRKVEALRKAVTKTLTAKFDKIIQINDVMLPRFEGNGLVLSHHPVDFATSVAYSRLSLLESHTGIVKRFPELHSKLTNGSELTNIPLNKLTIQVFGDRAVNFYSLPTGVKNEIKALAAESNWTSASTVSYCERTIRNLPNSNPAKPFLLKLI